MKGLPANPLLSWLIRLRRSGLLKKIPHKQLIVILILYSHRNVKGFAWPKITTLMEEAGVSNQTVHRTLRMAKVSLGVTWQKGVPRKALTDKQKEEGFKPPKRCNCYYLPLDAPIDKWQPSRKGRRKKKI